MTYEEDEVCRKNDKMKIILRYNTMYDAGQCYLSDSFHFSKCRQTSAKGDLLHCQITSLAFTN